MNILYLVQVLFVISNFFSERLLLLRTMMLSRVERETTVLAARILDPPYMGLNLRLTAVTLDNLVNLLKLDSPHL